MCCACKITFQIRFQVLFIITGTVCTFVKCVNDPLLEHFIDKELCPLEEPLPPKPFKINKKNLEVTVPLYWQIVQSKIYIHQKHTHMQEAQ